MTKFDDLRNELNLYYKIKKNHEPDIDGDKSDLFKLSGEEGSSLSMQFVVHDSGYLGIYIEGFSKPKKKKIAALHVEFTMKDGKIDHLSCAFGFGWYNFKDPLSFDECAHSIFDEMFTDVNVENVCKKIKKMNITNV